MKPIGLPPLGESVMTESGDSHNTVYTKVTYNFRNTFSA